MHLWRFSKTDWNYIFILNIVIHSRLWNWAKHYLGLVKKFSCRVCEKTFSSISGIKHHNKTKHDESNPNKCKVCLKVFANKCLLDVHTRVHTGEKPYVCTTCNKGFAQKVHLKRHEATHSEERKYKCNICTEEKFFKTDVGLGRHMKLHSEPTYSCSKCGKKFHDISNFIRHEKSYCKSLRS